MKTLSDELSETIPDALLKTLIDAGQRTAMTAKDQGDYRTAKVILNFDKSNPKALLWARYKSSTLIKDIDSDNRKAIREIMYTSFQKGIPPRSAARLIRAHIGLTKDQTGAVGGAFLKLSNAKTKGIVKVGKSIINIPEGGLSKEKILSIVDKYSTRSLNYRALMIARTETIAAANEGQRQLWLQAVEDGLLESSAKREWIVTPDDRLCESCEPLEGQIRGLTEFFESDLGNVIGPPLHPQCRCAVGLTDKTDKTDAEKDKQPEITKLQPAKPPKLKVTPPAPPPAEIPLPTPKLTPAPKNVKVPKPKPAPAPAPQPIPVTKEITSVSELGLSNKEANIAGKWLKSEGKALGLNSNDAAIYNKVQIEKALGAELRKKFSLDELIDFRNSIAGPKAQYYKTGKDQQLYKWVVKSANGRNYVTQELVWINESEFISREISKRLVSTWASTSADNHPLAIKMQHAIAKEFGLSAAKTAHFAIGDTFTNPLHEKIARAFARAMYDNTQKQFREAGITHLTLYRGMNVKTTSSMGDVVFGFDTMILQPASSFSASPSTAFSFAGEMVMSVRVPISEVLGTARTGYGCLNESEFVLLGRQLKASTMFGHSYKVSGYKHTKGMSAVKNALGVGK